MARCSIGWVTDGDSPGRGAFPSGSYSDDLEVDTSEGPLRRAFDRGCRFVRAVVAVLGSDGFCLLTFLITSSVSWKKLPSNSSRYPGHSQSALMH